MFVIGWGDYRGLLLLTLSTEESSDSEFGWKKWGCGEADEVQRGEHC